MSHTVAQNLLCCPACHGKIVERSELYQCTCCQASYPVILSIPDFRLGLSPTQREHELQKIGYLLEAYRHTTFSQLMEIHIKRTTTTDLLELERHYELDWEERGQKECYKIATLAEQYSINTNPLHDTSEKAYLDVGCGKGVLLATLGSSFRAVLGMDYSMGYLVLAKKLCDEQKLDNVFLACASNESLPVRDSTIDFMTALDVIEHITDQPKGVSENFRVLKNDGVLFLNSPNRYSLFALEDHVQLWGVGLLPRRFQKPYVNFRSGRSYEGVRLLSYREIKRMIVAGARYFVSEGIMFDPRKVSLSQKERLLKRYPFMLFILNRILKNFVPGFHFLAQK